MGVVRALVREVWLGQILCPLEAMSSYDFLYKSGNKDDAAHLGPLLLSASE